jgi:hypothetical protein
VCAPLKLVRATTLLSPGCAGVRCAAPTHTTTTQLEKDKVARQQIERVALAAGQSWRSPSPDYDGGGGRR